MLQGKRFYCREWAFQKLLHGLESRPSSKTCGTLIMGGPGSGKTALCTEIVWPTSNYGKQRSLSKRVLAYHFCQAHDKESLSMTNFILGLLNMISRSTLIRGFDEKIRTPSVQACLEPAAIEKNPDEAFKKGILQPLSSLNPPSRNCCILVDSVDEAYPHMEGERCSSSRTIAEILANHHELFPSWLSLVCSARRQSKTVTRMFTGFRKLSLDDLRKSHVVRDVQQYILCRLDREEALRQQLSRDTAEMLNQLHIKSNGCIMYLEKVLDGVAENSVSLKEISEIPGTLNGLYLWFCQRLFARKQFSKIRPIFNVLLAAKCPLLEEELFLCVRTKDCSLTREDFQERLDQAKRLLVKGKDKRIQLFHNSFVEWLQDVKYCTQKYLCKRDEGHAMLAMRFSCNASDLTPKQVQDFASSLVQARLIPPLDSSHLASWMIWMGTPLKDSLMTTTPKDQRVFDLLVSAGAKVVDLDEQSVSLQDALEKEESLKNLLDSGASINQVDTNGRSLLANAAYSGNVHMVKFLLGKGADVEITDRTGQTALGLASRQGHVDVVKAVLDHGCEIDHVDHDGWTPLRSAAWAGHTDVVATLLGSGAKVDCSDSDKRTALRAAAWGGHYDIVKKLSEHGANVNQSDNEGRTALIAAAYMGHSNIVEFLLDHKAEIDHEDCDGRTALSVAAMSVAVNEGHSDVVTLLINRGSKVDHSDHEGMSSLLVAAYEGHQEVVDLLLEGGADVDHTDNNNRSPLIAAASMGHCNIVKSLLKWDCAVDTIDNEGRTVLSIASAQGNTDIVKLLLERGLDEMHRDNHGWTPLHMASYEGHQEVCQVFMDQGPHIQVDIVDRDGRTPMILAAQEGHIETVTTLLDSGANVQHTAHDGRSPLRAATLESHKDVIDLLLKREADINYRDGEGRSTLYMLALENKIPMATYLLERQADTENPDLEGRTALHVASWQGHSDMVDLLLSYGANPNAVDKEKRSALQSAAWQGHVKVAKSLLEKGAIINHTCNQGASALCIAAQEGHVEVVQALLEHGADPNHADKHGRTAMRVALKGSHQSVIKLLEQYGVQNLMLSPQTSRSSHSKTSTTSSTSSNHQSAGSSAGSNHSDMNNSASTRVLTNGALLQASSPSNSPDSTFDKRKSSTSNQSSKSSSMSASNSTIHLHSAATKETSFTEQLQQHLNPNQSQQGKVQTRARSPGPEAARTTGAMMQRMTPASSFQTIPENIVTAHSSEQLQQIPGSQQQRGRHFSGPNVQSPRRSPSPVPHSSRSTSPSVQSSSPLSQQHSPNMVTSPQHSPKHYTQNNNNRPMSPQHMQAYNAAQQQSVSYAGSQHSLQQYGGPHQHPMYNGTHHNLQHNCNSSHHGSQASLVSQTQSTRSGHGGYIMNGQQRTISPPPARPMSPQVAPSPCQSPCCQRRTVQAHHHQMMRSMSPSHHIHNSQTKGQQQYEPPHPNEQYQPHPGPQYQQQLMQQQFMPQHSQAYHQSQPGRAPNMGTNGSIVTNGGGHPQSPWHHLHQQVPLQKANSLSNIPNQSPSHGQAQAYHHHHHHHNRAESPHRAPPNRPPVWSPPTSRRQGQVQNQQVQQCQCCSSSKPGSPQISPHHYPNGQTSPHHHGNVQVASSSSPHHHNGPIANQAIPHEQSRGGHHERSNSQPIIESVQQDHHRKASLPVSFNQVNLQRVLSSQPAPPGSPEIKSKRRSKIKTNPNFKGFKNQQNKGGSVHGSNPMLTPSQSQNIISSGDNGSISAIELKHAMKINFEGHSTKNGLKKETPL